MRLFLLVFPLSILAPPLFAQEEKEEDGVILNDGSVIRGEILSLDDGKIRVKTGFSGTLSIDFSKVSRLVSSRVLFFQLADGVKRQATASSPDDRKLELSVAASGEKEATVEVVDFDRLLSIKIPEAAEKSAIKGGVNFGGGATDGNTKTKSASFNADLEGRFDNRRLSVGMAYNFAEDLAGLTARNSKARLKYDYFVTEELFLFGSVLVEEDSFQDLNMRAALAGGPGYQLVEAGDLQAKYLKGLSAYGEIGLSYVDEDFSLAADNSYLAAKWSINMDWKILPRISLFHRHEGYPSLADMDDFYLTTETGLRVSVFENFVSTLQVNWRWDNSPSPGFGRSDTNYLLTLGYTFDF